MVKLLHIYISVKTLIKLLYRNLTSVRRRCSSQICDNTNANTASSTMAKINLPQ